MPSPHSSGPLAPATPLQRNQLVIASAVLGVAIIAASFFIIQAVRANSDYICTHIVEEAGNCTNGSWGDWRTVSSGTDAAVCTTTTVEKRVYTGVRTTRHIVEYLNLRTKCDPGFVQSKHGKSDGDSGYMSGTGKIVTESVACQIEETRTTRAPASAAPGCSAATTTDLQTAQSDVGPVMLDEEGGGYRSADELMTAFREKMIAGNIGAIPSIVRMGGTSVLRWQTREMTECSVTGSNGDRWDGTSGERTSGAINERTTFTLTCTAFNGDIVTDEAIVSVVPVYEEI